MTTVCLRPKKSVKTETWSSVFSAFNTETKSSYFMKQLTNTCISTILYLRRILPEEYFETKNFEGMGLKVLKSGQCFKYLDKIQTWLDGAFDAIDKKYLKHLMLDIKDAKSEMNLEIYTMTYQYQTESDEPNVLLSSTNAVKDRESSVSGTQLKTIRLLQMCYAVTQSATSLPPQITLAIRLAYHEDVPDNYHPNGYKAWEPSKPLFPKDTRTIEMGVTETNHHMFKLVNKSCFNDSFFKEVEKIKNERKTKAKRGLCFDGNTTPEEDVASMIQATETIVEEPEENKQNSSTVTNTTQNLHQGFFEGLTQNSQSQNTVTSTQTSSTYDAEAKLERVRCPCLSPEKFSIMFLCSGCKYWSHAECFGVLQFDFSKKIRFYCNLCHEEEGARKCHDKVIIKLKNSEDQQKVAFLRRVLKYCNLPGATKITLKKIEKMAGTTISEKVVQIVLKKIMSIEVVVPQGKKKNYKIDKQKLSERLCHYFYPPHYLDATMSKISTLSMRTPDMMKRKIMDFNDDYNNKKYRKSTVAEQIFGTQKLKEDNSQFSSDLFLE